VNRILNGDFAVYQGGPSVNPLRHLSITFDRWIWGQQQGGSVMRWDVDTDTPDASVPYSSKFTCVTAAPAGNDTEKHIRYGIEGSDFRELAGKTCTLTFHVKSNTPGTYSVAFVAYSRDYVYVTEYTIDQPDVWEAKTITVPFDTVTGGVWNQGNDLGCGIRFAMSSGGNYQGQPDTWNNQNVTSSAAQMNLGSMVGNYLKLAKVQLTPGTEPQPFHHRPLAETFRACTRYLYVLTAAMARRTPSSSVTTGTVTEIYVPLPTRLRATPRVTIEGVPGQDWVLRTSGDAQPPSFGTVQYLPAYGRDMGLIRFEGGTFTPGQALHLLLINSNARVVFNAEII